MGLPDYNYRPIPKGWVRCPKHAVPHAPDTGCAYCRTDEPLSADDYIKAIGPDVPGGKSALDVQISGDHYKRLGIQPIEYIHANNIPFAEGCAIKYLTRWRSKGGIKDLEKARHFIDLLIELESKAAA